LEESANDLRSMDMMLIGIDKPIKAEIYYMNHDVHDS
jgi:hypothetical protein